MRCFKNELFFYYREISFALLAVIDLFISHREFHIFLHQKQKEGREVSGEGEKQTAFPESVIVIIQAAEK